ncbi:phototropic-responsive NPH3 family protein [Actinidia rufa]|uniref:Phototropic-responsive NPH3 family protein n=1 Tax=Actinidia rufa TaxID=165716 RepID=A0A7J0GBU4_9ERIC|nr:phototropic-responsive NPH3 family protein [Actinidia rufa]
MKFMKLGSKPDAFQAEGNSVRYASSELATDVITLLNRFMVHEKRNWDLDAAENNEKISGDFVLGHGSLLRVVPETARPIHDGLYRAIDIYLKEHPNLTKAERKKICGMIDVKKLTMDASMHAAQNERLPLRVVVQVLYFEQVRTAARAQGLGNHRGEDSNSLTNTEEDWEKTVPDEGKLIRKHMSQLKVTVGNVPKQGKLTKIGSKTRGSGVQMLRSKSRRIFDKLWLVGKGHGIAENRNSETSGNSPSPTSMFPGETKSSGSSSRHRRHSIS